jgi:mRNA interferase YafQ
MKTIDFSGKFTKDLKLMQKRGKPYAKLQSIMNMIAEGETLDAKYKAHKLIGNFLGYMECHIEPDWLLIWKDTPEMVYFVRTGTHSDLF